MKKKYIRPFVEAASMMASEILAESLPIFIDGPSVPGPSTQTKKNEWDIFGAADEDTDFE